jgi:hypothetical protein
MFVKKDLTLCKIRGLLLLTGHQSYSEIAKQSKAYKFLGADLASVLRGGKIVHEGGEMKLALILICIFFISATGQSVQTATSDDILYDDINSLYGWVNPELFYNVCQNTQKTAIDSHSVIANSCISMTVSLTHSRRQLY